VEKKVKNKKPHLRVTLNEWPHSMKNKYITLNFSKLGLFTIFTYKNIILKKYNKFLNIILKVV